MELEKKSGWIPRTDLDESVLVEAVRRAQMSCPPGNPNPEPSGASRCEWFSARCIRDSVNFRRTLRFLYLAYFSKPVADRRLFRLLRQRPIQSIVEIGIPDIQRTLRILEVVALYHDRSTLRYSGVDWFEARGEGAVPLKRTHQLLTPHASQVRLVPGDPLGALSRMANSLMGTDLLLIHASQEPESLAQAWFFVPRMLHETSLVLVEETKTGKAGQPETAYRDVSLAEVEALATSSRRIPRKAA